jgi:prepilin-type N-terminal cleavage/methylation domain-containing protein
MKKTGFTLIEVLAVIVIISILAAIIVPIAGKAKGSALKRRAAMEMQSIKVAVMQFYADHKYMPWPEDVKVGDDMWTTDASTQEAVIELLTGNNPIGKVYLQIPEKSRPADKRMVFLDPWKDSSGLRRPYLIGMDRNMDGTVLVAGTGVPEWDNKKVVEKVLVVSSGPPNEDEPMKTFDITD